MQRGELELYECSAFPTRENSASCPSCHQQRFEIREQLLTWLLVGEQAARLAKYQQCLLSDLVDITNPLMSQSRLVLFSFGMLAANTMRMRKLLAVLIIVTFDLANVPLCYNRNGHPVPFCCAGR